MVGRIRAAGFVQITGDEAGRRYRSPDGREVSYRQAFKEARGETLEAAVKNPGAFSDELRIAERVRFLARNGLLSETTAVTKADERKLSRMTLRQITKGHYESGATARAMAGRGVKQDVYERAVLQVLRQEPNYSPLPGEDGPATERRIEKERSRINSPTGDKANLLVALGFRDADADYDVGETP